MFQGRTADPISPPPPVPSYSLFDSRSVGMATFLGSPLAGSILLGLNYRRLGNKGAAIAAVAAGTIVTALLLLVSYAVTSNAVMSVLPIALMFGMIYSAKTLQGPAVEQHVSVGGSLGSRWAAAGTGLAVLVVLAAMVFAYVYVDIPTKKVTIGANDEVFYTGAATAQDAKALGQALVEVGYFKDRGVSAIVLKGRDGVTVSFVVREGAWDDSTKVSAYEQIGRGIAPSIGGLPLKLRLVNNTFDVKKEIIVK